MMNAPKKTTSFYAHTGKTTNATDWQLLSRHLIAVGKGAGDRGRAVDYFAALSGIGFETHARLAGWLHDLGKYRPEFQDRLFGRPVSRERTYHKQAGAAKAALLAYNPIAFAIAGHHGGMPSTSCLKDAVCGMGGKPVADQVWDVACKENPELSKLVAPCQSPISSPIEIDFASRIVLSCLVDADWEDTSNFHRSLYGLEPEPLPPPLNPARRLDQLLDFIQQRSATCLDLTIGKIRDDILQYCLSAACKPTGVFSLTVPTGGGKTLSSLAFALKHSDVHSLRRIVYVAPFLSIIDQNTDVMRSALRLTVDDRTLFAHHSLSNVGDDNDDNDENATERMAAMRRAENWDSPLIVTTNVQFFESLFSNKPAACRKLHNLAGSVLLLDECQAIPVGLVAPTCAMLKQLSQQLKCTIVLCTATQPVFNHVSIPSEQRLNATEIVPDPPALFRQLNRVTLQWPQLQEYWSWKDVANRMCESESSIPRALCIVNSRRGAREVFAELKQTSDDGVFHLSTSMCPAHRMGVLEKVRSRLRDRRKCLLVSTQLIEAGVDVDFPIVLREMGPLESVIQAAGRCNREGRLTMDGVAIKGRVVIFRSTAFRDEPARYYPPDQWYKAGRTTLETNFLAAGRLPEVDQPEDISDYYARLFHSGLLDEKEVHQSRENLNFPRVAEDYRIIKDDSIPIVVGKWESQQATIDHLLRLVRTDPSRANHHKLAPYQINVRRHELLSSSLIAKPFEHLDIRVWYGVYDEAIGMDSDESDPLMIV